MEQVPAAVVHRVLAPFLRLRDIRSMQSVSRSLYRTWHPLDHTLPDLRSYICTYQSCPNRKYIHTNLDPFLLYELPERVRYVRRLVTNIVVGAWATPVYILPVCRVLCASCTTGELDAAIVEYKAVEATICALTRTRSVICMCTRWMDTIHGGCTCTPCSSSIPGGDCLKCILRGCDTLYPMLPVSFSCCVVCVSTVAGVVCMMLTRWCLYGLYALLLSG